MMMKKSLIQALLATTLISSPVLVSAQNEGEKTIETSDAWIRFTPGTIPMAGYFTLNNSSDQTITITGAESADFGHVMMHQTVNDSGQMSMQHMGEGLDVAAASHVTFAPGGMHLMLMQRQRPLTPGDHVNVTLNLADGGAISVEFEVKPISYEGP
ncbi:copper chaperone PCu(A)C [Hahella aquimaris]|uniref:copper chaperone PCu(A)C n=1 Tax=Hahella sp. HNIBRBA332 TaxID=3015983 RepID=UPI00273AB0D3|nr:copper chaperone PCu(A)C [Hahella sp. HNIBRBA332]WLQ16596.1 copper chaperone PCu(A)C [Hahella sp. HNIBRBA332]